MPHASVGSCSVDIQANISGSNVAQEAYVHKRDRAMTFASGWKDIGKNLVLPGSRIRDPLSSGGHLRAQRVR